jgi:hypothetical protein
MTCLDTAQKYTITSELNEYVIVFTGTDEAKTGVRISLRLLVWLEISISRLEI